MRTFGRGSYRPGTSAAMRRFSVISTGICSFEDTPVAACTNSSEPPSEPRVSSMHVTFERSAERWFIQDISRNGTWMRDVTTGEESLLPNCKQVPLPREGVLCLGRPFTADPAGHFTVSFKLARD